MDNAEKLNMCEASVLGAHLFGFNCTASNDFVRQHECRFAQIKQKGPFEVPPGCVYYGGNCTCMAAIKDAVARLLP